MMEAVLVLGVIGLIAGSGLAFASKYFYVVKDERIELVKDMLSVQTVEPADMQGVQH